MTVELLLLSALDTEGSLGRSSQACVGIPFAAVAMGLVLAYKKTVGTVAETSQSGSWRACQQKYSAPRGCVMP